MKKFDSFYYSLQEKAEYTQSDLYKILSPRMKKAVADIFSQLEKNPDKFMSNFDSILSSAAKKHKVDDNKLQAYFEKETLGLG